jgi:hypothetical protein
MVSLLTPGAHQGRSLTERPAQLGRKETLAHCRKAEEHRLGLQKLKGHGFSRANGMLKIEGGFSRGGPRH